MALANVRFGPFWIVGYGNPLRRDDGIGLYVGSQLEHLFGDTSDIRIRHLHQLDPVLLEDLKDAQGVVFVDATVEQLTGGWKWMRLQPQTNEWPRLSHVFQPQMLLELIHHCSGRHPSAWLITIQGEDFSFGEDLSPAAKRRADRVIQNIAIFARLYSIVKQGAANTERYNSQTA
jgi:hydrogenase maturation protease